LPFFVLIYYFVKTFFVNFVIKLVVVDYILFNATKKRVTVLRQVLEMIIPEIASHHCVFI